MAGPGWWQLENGAWVRSDVVSASAGCSNLQPDPQIWIDYAREKLSTGQDILESIGDGSWHESIHYQSYTLAMTLPFLVNLRRLERTDIFPHHYLQNYPAWMIANYIPDTTQFILAYGDFEWDWTNYARPFHLLRFAAREYGDHQAEWLAQQLIATDGRTAEIWSMPWYVYEFFYYNPAVTPESPANLSKSRVFPDLEGVIWRTGWETDDLIFGMKTGSYGGRYAFETFTQGLYPWEAPCNDSGCSMNTGHDHDDTNGFYLYKAGAWLAPENVGVEKTATSLHNTVLIDGAGQYRPRDDHFGIFPEDYIGRDGSLLTTVSSASFDYLAADATRRYEVSDLQDVTRYVVFVRPDYFIMLDRFSTMTPHQVDWVTHFSQQVSLEGRWVRGEAGNGQILGVAVIEPESFEADVGDDGLPFVHIHAATPAADARLINLLFPTSSELWDEKPTVTLLQDNGQAAAVNVQMNDGSGGSDTIILGYGQSDTELITASYESDAQVVVLSHGLGGSPEKLFVYGGVPIWQTRR